MAFDDLLCSSNPRISLARSFSTAGLWESLAFVAIADAIAILTFYEIWKRYLKVLRELNNGRRWRSQLSVKNGSHDSGGEHLKHFLSSSPAPSSFCPILQYTPNAHLRVIESKWTYLCNQISEAAWVSALASSSVYAYLGLSPVEVREDWIVTKVCWAAGLAWLFFILCFFFFQRSLTPRMLWVKSIPVMFVLWLVMGRQLENPYPAIPLAITYGLLVSKNLILDIRVCGLAVHLGITLGPLQIKMRFPLAPVLGS